MHARTTAHAATLAIAALAGCDGDTPAPAPAPEPGPFERFFTSGTRLRARYVRLEGGARELTGWYDAALDLPCSFESEAGEPFLGPGGVSYCLPAGAGVHRADRGPFADPACVEPVGRAAAPSGFVVLRPEDACAAAPIVRRATVSTRRLVYFLRDGTCALEAAQGVVLEPAEEIPLATFVVASEAPAREASARITPRARVTADGAKEIVGAWDNERGAPARVARDSAGARRWTPARVAFVEPGSPSFEDAACSRPAASKAAHSASCPIDAVHTLRGACGAGSFSAIGSRLDATFTRGGGGACVPSSTGALRFTIGAPIEDDAFVEARARLLLAGGAGIEALTAADGATPIAQGALYDARLRSRCVVTRAPSGALRCFPAALADAGSFFVDAACARPALVRRAGDCAEQDTPDAAVSGFSPTGRRAYAVGAQADGLFARAGGACANVAIPHDAAVFALLEVPEESLPLAEEMRE